MSDADEIEANMVRIEAKPLMMRSGFRHFEDAIAQANMRAAITCRRYRVTQTPHGHWWLTETTQRVPSDG